MIETLITPSECPVQEAEYRRLLGYPSGHEPGARAQELAAWARRWFAANGRPWVYLREAGLQATDGALRLGGREFHSEKLRDHFRQSSCRRAVLVAASAGRACEEHARRLWEEAKPDEYFFLEIFGSAVVEQLIATTSGRICELAEHDGLMAVPPYSPGYAGWDVAEQNRLHELIFQGSSPAMPEPLEVLPSGMLRPKKSLLAVFGLTAHDGREPETARWIPCHHCSFSPCRYRRAAYRSAPRRLDGAPVPRPASAGAPPATGAGYTVSPRALQKWAGERVRLRQRADGRVEASFRFDGTTCSNLGQPLAFDYELLLGSPGEGHPILRADCRPAEGDEGHAKMCAYVTDGPALRQALDAEKPLLGRPLREVLGWERTPAPAGCLCTAESRAHKWGLALEVIHYALARDGTGRERAPVPAMISPPT